MIRLVFVGSHLSHVLSLLNQKNYPFLVLHPDPSILSVKFSLQPLLAPICPDPLLQRDKSNPACYFAPKKLSKLSWSPIEISAPALFTFLQLFSFSSEEYTNLLGFTTSDSSKDENQACEWMQANDKVVRAWVHKMRELMKVQEKPKLYIGGIFPQSGTKYKAPVLAEGW